MRMAISVFLLLAFLSVPAHAVESTYVISAPEFRKGNNAEAALAAVQRVKGVTAVDVDPVVHAMTVRVADEGAVIEVIKALNSAGFAVGDPVLKEAGNR